MSSEFYLSHQPASGEPGLPGPSSCSVLFLSGAARPAAGRGVRGPLWLGEGEGAPPKFSGTQVLWLRACLGIARPDFSRGSAAPLGGVSTANPAETLSLSVE